MNNYAVNDIEENINQLRAIALYRVSTKAQSGEDDDLPTQKKIVQDFMWQQNFKIIREFTESGVSAYKNKSSEREKIQLILDMAKRKEFDILVIYHSNRLGRLAEDTPALITKFSRLGIKVVSVKEGELKAKTSIDRFQNSVRYFVNEQESENKSEVITDYQLAMVEEGRFRGGSMIPIGYKLIDQGSKNFKGKHIMDFVIDKDYADVVKLIFKLSVEMNYGQQRIAKYLNEETNYKTKKGKGWHSTSIGTILNNSTYKGVLHMNSKVREKKVVSPIREDLIIILPEIWDRNQEIMKSRRYTKEIDDVRDKRETKNIYGKMLLNSIAYCGNCGSALTTHTAYTNWTTVDGVEHKGTFYKYRCGSFYKKGSIKCEGQNTYGMTVIEPIAIEYAKKAVRKLLNKKLKSSFFEQFDKNISEYTKQKQILKTEIEKHYEELKVLKEEIVKVLMGQSEFTRELINDLINKKQEDINNKTKILESIDTKISREKEAKRKYTSLNNEFVGWEERFDNAQFEIKRLMLSKVIKKFIVYNRNEFDVEYDIYIDTFDENAEVEDSVIDCKDTTLVRTNRVCIQPISIYKETVKIRLAS
jgi:site-specific DNA recombinase